MHFLISQIKFKKNTMIIKKLLIHTAKSRWEHTRGHLKVLSSKEKTHFSQKSIMSAKKQFREHKT